MKNLKDLLEKRRFFVRTVLLYQKKLKERTVQKRKAEKEIYHIVQEDIHSLCEVINKAIKTKGYLFQAEAWEISSNSDQYKVELIFKVVRALAFPQAYVGKSIEKSFRETVRKKDIQSKIESFEDKFKVPLIIGECKEIK